MSKDLHLIKTSTSVDFLYTEWATFSERISIFIASLMVFVMYPFFYLYWYHMAIGNLPSFMDNIFGLITLLAAILLSFFFLTGEARRLDRSTAAITILFFIFVAYTLSWVLIHYLLADGILSDHELFSYYSRRILNYFTLFLVGFYFRPEKWNKLFFLLFLIIFINAFIYMNWGRMMIDLRNVIDPVYRGIYLSLSTTALFTGLLAWSGIKHPFFRLLVLLLMVPLLFVIGSRADLVAFVIVLPLALYFTLRPTWLMVVYMSTILLITGSVVIGWDKLEVTRHFQIFTPDQFTSLLARNRYLIWGVDRIADSPIIGDYGGTLAELGSIGMYIHNFLSVWQAFGVLPFLIYAGLILIVFYIGLKLFIKNGRKLDCEAQLIVVLGLVVTIEVLLAKSMGWYHVALVWGLVAGWVQRKAKPNILQI